MKIGLALGGGGVRCLAHVLVLEVLDELGIRPDRVSGTSMGAIIGAMYASGLKGAEIREEVQGLTISKSDKAKDVWDKKDQLSRWFKFFRFAKLFDFSLKKLTSGFNNLTCYGCLIVSDYLLMGPRLWVWDQVFNTELMGWDFSLFSRRSAHITL